MTALLITLTALLVAMIGRAVLDPQSWRSGRDTEETKAEERARLMESIALSVF
jgi:hypothetical protein